MPRRLCCSAYSQPTLLALVILLALTASVRAGGRRLGNFWLLQPRGTDNGYTAYWPIEIQHSPHVLGTQDTGSQRSAQNPRLEPEAVLGLPWQCQWPQAPYPLHLPGCASCHLLPDECPHGSPPRQGGTKRDAQSSSFYFLNPQSCSPLSQSQLLYPQPLKVAAIVHPLELPIAPHFTAGHHPSGLSPELWQGRRQPRATTCCRAHLPWHQCGQSQPEGTCPLLIQLFYFHL